jgi:hypothetical protein
MIRFHGERLTANQLAQYLVATDGTCGAEYWAERYIETYRPMTQREVDAVDAAIDRHSERVRKLLNTDKIHTQIFGD